jgi:hypothetical protein
VRPIFSISIAAAIIIGVLIGVGTLQGNQSESPQVIEREVIQQPDKPSASALPAVQSPNQPIQPQETGCDLSYPTLCIPPNSPDLDCNQISETNFKVYQPDPHGFDGDKDGIGCES